MSSLYEVFGQPPPETLARDRQLRALKLPLVRDLLANKENGTFNSLDFRKAITRRVRAHLLRDANNLFALGDELKRTGNPSLYDALREYRQSPRSTGNTAGQPEHVDLNQLAKLDSESVWLLTQTAIRFVDALTTVQLCELANAFVQAIGNDASTAQVVEENAPLR